MMERESPYRLISKGSPVTFHFARDSIWVEFRIVSLYALYRKRSIELISGEVML